MEGSLRNRETQERRRKKQIYEPFDQHFSVPTEDTEQQSEREGESISALPVPFSPTFCGLYEEIMSYWGRKGRLKNT